MQNLFVCVLIAVWVSAFSSPVLSQSKEQEEAHETFVLGIKYLQGDKEAGIGRDLEKAVGLFMKAREVGHSGAMYYLGTIYERRRGYRDLKQSFKYYLEGAEAGGSPSMTRVGDLYREGRGVAVDMQNALRWYQNAAAKGDMTAHFRLAAMYANGAGVTKNPLLAIENYQKVIALGSGNPTGIRKSMIGEAHSHIGMHYQKGEGVRRDYDKARELYAKGADMGSQIGQYRLAVMYLLPKFGNTDRDRAVNLLKQSAKRKYQPAIDALEKLGE